MTTTKKAIETKADSEENLLTLVFLYNEFFKEMAELDVSSYKGNYIVEEFRIDYNRDHFIRDKFFKHMDFFDENT
jgi:hypothetical protein